MLKLRTALSFCLLLGSPIVAFAKHADRNVNYIVGGEVIPILEAPYQAVLFYNNEFHCGGNIIAPIWILTAGHCVVDQNQFVFPSDALVVKVGVDDAFDPAEDTRDVDTVFVHPSFSLPEINFDVALLRLLVPLLFSARVACIPLAPPGTPVITGDSVFVTGYGQTSEYDSSPPADTHLRSIYVNIVDHDECFALYNPGLVVTERMFCAAAPQKGTCHYDSGGPAVLRGELLGLVSGGRICADEASPGLYAFIPSMRDWIDITVLENSQHYPVYGQCN